MATYKSIISQVITDFNAIQNSMHAKGVTGVSEVSNANSSTLIPTSELSTYISRYLVFPTGNLTIDGAGTFKVATDVSNESRTGHATVSVNSAVLPELTGAENGGKFVISSGLTTAGWVASDSRKYTMADAAFTVDGKNIKTTAAGYVTNNKTVATLNDATFNGSYTQTSITEDGSTTISNMYNIKEKAAVYTSAPTQTNGKYFYAFDYAGSVTTKAATEGYIAAQAVAGTSTSVGGKGYVVIDSAELQQSSAAVADLVKKNSDDEVSKTRNINSIIDLIDPSQVGNKGVESGYYISLTANGSAGSVNVKTEGYAKDLTQTVSVTPTNRYISVKSAIIKNSASDDITYTDDESTQTILNDGYLYIDEGYVPNTRISLSHLIPDIDDAIEINSTKANFILHGYKAFDDAGNIIEGTMADANLVTNKANYFTATPADGVADSVITSGTYNNQSVYIKSGTVTAPTAITGESGTVTVSNGVVSISKTISVTPTVTKAGWISSGTAGNSEITISGSISTTNQTASSGYCTIETVTDPAAQNGSKAMVYDTVDSGATYVTIHATGSGDVSVGTGYIGEGTTRSNEQKDDAKILAIINQNFDLTGVSGSKTIGDITTFTKGTNNTTVTAGGTKTDTITVGGSLSNSDVADKYIVGGITVDASGEATATIFGDATGKNVDDALISLLNRMSGFSYEEVSAT